MLIIVYANRSKHLVLICMYLCIIIAYYVQDRTMTVYDRLTYREIIIRRPENKCVPHND